MKRFLQEWLPLIAIIAFVIGYSILALSKGPPRRRKDSETDSYRAGYDAGFSAASDAASDDAYERGYEDGYARAQDAVDSWCTQKHWFYEQVFTNGFSEGYEFCLEEYEIVEITPAPTSRPKSSAPSGGNRPAITAAPTTPAPTFFYPGFPSLPEK